MSLYEHLRTAATISAKGAHVQTRRNKGALCANHCHAFQCIIPTHRFIGTPITTHGLMRTPSLIDGKPPWMGKRPCM
jgi:hypothetical protein